jgi:hypothetical protein
MLRRLPQLLFLQFVMACLCAIASADQIAVGVLSYDGIAASQDQFDITDLTGLAAFPPDEPITTMLTFTVSSLVVNFTSVPSLTLPGSDFTIVDTDGDLDCTATACNLFGDSITSAILAGTLSPTTGLSGLPSGDTGIEADFTTTITPDSVNCSGGTLEAGCDAAIIYATGKSGVVVPEPAAWALVGAGMIGLFLIGCRRRSGTVEALKRLLG